MARKRISQRANPVHPGEMLLEEFLRPTGRSQAAGTTMKNVVNIHQAKTHLSRLVADVAAGAEVVIAKSGRPVARLVPLENRPRRKTLGLLKGRLRVPDTFNAPLPDEVIADFGGR